MMPAYAVKKGPTHRTSPATLGLIIAGHAAAIAFLALTGGVVVERFIAPPTIVDFIPEPPEPPVIEPEVVPEPMPIPVPQLVTPEPLIKVPVSDPVTMVQVPDFDSLNVPVTPRADGPAKVTPAPTISEARLATPSHLIEPPYPAAKQNAGEEARLKLLLSIDAKGRVTSVVDIGGADPVFVAAARKHILRHWRYRPAMQGSVPVATSKSISLTFTLRD